MDEFTLNYPALDPTVEVVPLADERVQIRTPSECFTVGRQSRLAFELTQLCDGSRHREEVVSELLRRGHTEPQARELMRILIQKAVLIHKDELATDDLLLAHARHFAQRRSGSGGLVSVAVADHVVQVVGSGELARAVRTGLTQLGIVHVDTPVEDRKSLALGIACSDREDHAAFREYNDLAVRERQPTLFACITETRVRVGPFVIPGDTACFECFHHRLRGNVTFREEFDGFLAHEAAQAAAEIRTPARIYARLGSALICAQATNFLNGVLQYCLFDRTVEITVISAEWATGAILKLPHCDVCGRTARSPLPAARDWL